MTTADDDTKTVACGDEGDDWAERNKNQTVTRITYPPKEIPAAEVAKSHDCYASMEELRAAIADGTYQAGRDTVMIGGRLYFLCDKK